MKEKQKNVYCIAFKRSGGYSTTFGLDESDKELVEFIFKILKVDYYVYSLISEKKFRRGK